MEAIADISRMNNFQKLCVLSFVSLKQLERNSLKPIGMASGCIVKYKDFFWLLTVFHAVEQGDWALEIRYEPRKQKMECLYPLPHFSFTFLKEINLSNELRKALEEGDTVSFKRHIDKSPPTDFAFRRFKKEELDKLPPYYQEILPNGIIRYEEKKRIFDTNLDNRPQKGKKYGFAGFTMPEFDGYNLIQNLTVETDLLFEGEFKKEDGSFYLFKLHNKEHPGHEFYKGCSGAPIIDEDGNLVSLVVEGNEKENCIYGINLAKYKVVIDAELEVEKLED